MFLFVLVKTRLIKVDLEKNLQVLGGHFSIDLLSESYVGNGENDL